MRLWAHMIATSGYYYVSPVEVLYSWSFADIFAAIDMIAFRSEQGSHDGDNT